MAEVVSGEGALERSFASVSGEGWIVLCGRTSFATSGAERVLAPFLERITALRRVEGPLPNIEEVDDLARSMSGLKVSSILSVGGGLVLDTAKVLSLSLVTGQKAGELLAGRADVVGPPSLSTVAVPTTAGSGAERTPFAVMYQSGVKHSLDDARLLPRTVVLDPLLMRSVPTRIAAAAGLDAMAHCIESLWATRSTPESQALATDALRTIAGHIEPAILGNSAGAIDAMALASSAAGAAIATTRTTAAHALSYHLTSRHGVAHGHAVALTLGRLVEFNEGVDEATCHDPRGVEHVRHAVSEICSLLGVDDGEAAREFLKDLVARLGLATTVDGASTTVVDRAAWVAEVNPHRLSNNPRLLTQADLDELARAA